MVLFAKLEERQRKWLFCTGVVLLVLAVELLFLVSAVLPRSKSAVSETQLISIESGVPMINGTSVDQVVYSKKPLRGVAIRIGTYGRESGGVLQTSVYDNSTMELLLRQETELENVEDNALFPVTWDTNLETEGGLYLIRFEISDMPEGGAYFFWYTDTDVSGIGETAVSAEQETEGYLLIQVMAEASFLLPMYLAICAVLDLLLAAVGILVCKKSKISTLFPICALLFGSLLMLVYTPYSVHDEERHIPWALTRASAWASGRWDVQDETGEMREEELMSGYTVMKPGAEQYKLVLSSFFQTESTDEMIEVEVDPRGVPYEYAPQIAGILLARALHLGQTPTLYLAQMFALLFYIALCWMAIRISPYPTLFAILALCPSILRSAGSFSYDSFINAVSFLLVALWLHLIETDDRITWKHTAAVTLLSLVLAPCKGIYIFICLLVVLLPRKRWKFRWFREWMMAFLLLAETAVMLLALGTQIETKGSGEGTVIGPWGNEAYSVSMLLAQPFELIRLTASSVFDQCVSLVLSAIGGIQHINLPLTVNLALLVVMLMAAGMEEKRPSVPQRVVFALISLITVGLGYAAAITWTTVGSYYFIGMQGRYLVPILPLLLLAVAPRVQIKLRREQLLFGAVLLDAYSILYLFIQVIW